jgi:multidrug resistance efflux pump
MLIGPRHTWLKLVVIAVFAVVLLLTFVQGNDYVEGTFTAQPQQQHIITAPFEGELLSVLAEPGDEVQPRDSANPTLLAMLDVRDERERLSKARAEYERYLDEIQSAETRGKQDEAGIAKKRARETLAAIRLYESQIARSELYSPIAGEVVSDDLTRKETGTVQKGETLFVIATTGQIRADIHIPEDRISQVQVGDKGELASKSDPGNFIEFTILEIDPVAQAVDNKNVFRASAEIHAESLPIWLRPGVEGVSRIKVGEASYGYLWTRDLVNWVRMKLWI